MCLVSNLSTIFSILVLSSAPVPLPFPLPPETMETTNEILFCIVCKEPFYRKELSNKGGMYEVIDRPYNFGACAHCNDKAHTNSFC